MKGSMLRRMAGRVGMAALAVGVVALTAAATIIPDPPPNGDSTWIVWDPETKIEFSWPDAPRGARGRADGWFPARKPKDRPALPKEVTRAYVIPIREQITPTLYQVLARKALQARNAGAQLIIFDLDTPGGRSDAMDAICQMIVDDLENVYTVAYVDPRAFSAGAMIAVACNEIVMARSGVIGAAMPIAVGPGNTLVPIPPEERTKFESADRGQARAIAARNDYDGDLSDAMITIKVELWLIRNVRTMELQVIRADDLEWKGRVRGAPTAEPAAAAPTADGTATTPAATPPSAAEPQWEFLKQVDGPDELATFTSDEAVEVGLVDHVFATMDDLLKHYNVTEPPARMPDNWSERLVGFLTSPLVMGVLIFLAVIGAWTEFHTPGFGLPGTVAVVCLAIAFGSQYLIGAAQWWELLLIVIGIVLIALEIFVIPGFGAAGVTGGIFLVVGILASIIPQAPNQIPWPDTALAWQWFSSGLFALGTAFVLSLVAMPIVSKFLPKIPVASRLVIAPSEPATDAPVSDDSPMKRVRVGDAGTVHSVLRPVGKVRFGNDILDAMSEGDIIETGAAVRVLRREGNRLVVEKVS